jgi:hypothetical protein
MSRNRGGRTVANRDFSRRCFSDNELYRYDYLDVSGSPRDKCEDSCDV